MDKSSSVIIYTGILIICGLEKNRSEIPIIVVKNHWKRTSQLQVMILVGFNVKYAISYIM